jgi:alpha-N-arabinofuranosidase
VQSPRHETAGYGDVDTVSAVGTYDDETGSLTLFAVNRSPDAPVDLNVDMRSLGLARLVEHSVLTSDDPHELSSKANAARVRPRALSASELGSDQHLRATLPAVSWNVLRLERRPLS